MIDPITATLTAGTIVGNVLSARDQQKSASQALAFQRALADEQMRFAKSARTDAYGNKVYYDDATGQWKTILSPTQQRLVDAGQREQLLGLTRDAALNRSVRERTAARGAAANEDYTRTNAAYKYGDQPSEGSLEDRLARLMAISRGYAISPNAVRTSGNLPIVYSAANANSYPSGQAQLADILMQARSGALNESSNRASARNSKYLPALQMYDKIASGGGGAPVNYSDTPGVLSNQEGDMAKLIANIGNNEARNVGTAFNSATKVAGKQYPTPDQMVKIIGALNGKNVGKIGSATAAEDATPGYYGGSPSNNPLLAAGPYYDNAGYF